MLATKELLDDIPIPSRALEDDEKLAASVDDDELVLVGLEKLLMDEDEDELKLLELLELLLFVLTDETLVVDRELIELLFRTVLLEDWEFSELTLDVLLDDES
jgi:hypothetical protein